MALMKSKRVKMLIWAGSIAAILAVAAWVSLSVLVPLYLESRLIPEMARKYGLDAKAVQIQRLGLWGAELGPFELEGDNTSVVRIAAVRIDYSPFTLMTGQVKGIAIAGVRVVLRLTPEGLVIPGLKLPDREPIEGPPKGFPDLGALLPVGLETVRLTESEIVILGKDGPRTIALEATLACGRLHQGILTGHGELAMGGNAVVAGGQLDQGANRVSFSIDSSTLLLDTLADMVELPPGMTLAARAELKGRARFQLTPLKFKSVSLTGQLHEVDIRTPYGSVENLPDPHDVSQPFAMGAETVGANHVRWHCGPFQIQSLVKTRIETVAGEWRATPAGWTMNAGIEAWVPAQKTGTGITFAKAVPMQWQVRAQQADQSVTQFEVHTKAAAPLSFEMAPYQFTCRTYQIDANGRIENEVLSAEGTLDADRMRLTLPDGEVVIPQIRGSSALLLQPSDQPQPSTINAQAVLSKVTAHHKAVRLNLPRIDIAASGQSDAAQPWQYQAELKIAKAMLNDPSRKMSIRNIGIDLPVQWPPVPRAPAGRLTVGTLQWNRHNLGDLKGRLQQKNRALEIALRHQSKLFPHLSVLVNGRLDETGGSINADLPSHRFAEAVDLGRFVPKAAGIMVDGQIQGGLDIKLHNGEIESTADFNVSRASLRHETHALSVDGIEATIRLEDLIALASAPHQKIRVGHLNLGQLKASDFDMDFQLQSERSLLVEKAHVDWCKGRIVGDNLRIAPNETVALFCDRLNLAMLLEQLGAAQAEGKGTVSGTILLGWRNGRLGLDRANLASTTGSAIQMSGTDALLVGLPPDTPQHTQVDIAIEALKDYSYEWVKLNAESQGENLLLDLQLDGKPNRLLPFAFDKQLGRLKRVSGEGQADFKGIRIDLNFKSPLDKMLQYKKLLTPNQ